jgi:hypothetical protein
LGPFSSLSAFLPLLVPVLLPLPLVLLVPVLAVVVDGAAVVGVVVVVDRS